MESQVSTKNITSKEQFWQEHVHLKQKSKLSRAEYCRKYDLHYGQLEYWESKLCPQKPVLLPIKLAIDNTSCCKSQTTLCTLAFKNGNVLTVHDKSIVPLLLSALA